MTIQDWFEKRKEAQIKRRELEARAEVEQNPDLWVKCVHCDAQLLKEDLANNDMVCPVCDYHFRINARKRVQQLFDEGSFEELFTNIKPTDPLEFVDTESYKTRLEKAQQKTNLNDAVITGVGCIEGHKVAAAVMDFDFMGGSMGSVVGEKVTRIIEKAIEQRLPVLAVTSSGGARMQESALSLMQMAKTSAALSRLSKAGLPFISVMCDPTMGGVSASLAMLGDINIAEPNALIGFAGPRVIEQTVRETLPEGFQRAEFLKEKGAVDMIVSRRDMRDVIASLLSKLMVRRENPLIKDTVDSHAEVTQSVSETHSAHTTSTKSGTAKKRIKPRV